ncbi:phenylacetic acid degradation operon negative regulatory protein PaaX [Hydrocarboniphaga sp.]|jgi:phenylacetic acid degradation operon negative regulatory protein|uniref:phenylacetic acid degradation operon negative regulatory protein PaaX n=1 Tax=Hydrocarboniphaga sp. TaxID=2033016 RepID=UPI002AB94FA4|nr:phenylacetic acid degradation operon negative regulatory protein PaaX [Hydrocarboniphaga sp.]MDZ4078461.1 phenylacetic acid degradation operon negative regulatory protein PaaX [Hydrocarboniphaga sp.]
MAVKYKSIDDWIKRYLKEEEPRSKSLIVSVFGDSIAPCASGVWLGELIELMEPFDVNERLVRTSSFRLIEEGWLESIRDGRRSRYALTSLGKRRFAHAYRRIYTPPPSNWDGRWTLVMLTKAGVGAPERSELRKELEWEGFGMIAPGIFVHPSADVRMLAEILDQLELRERTMVLSVADLSELSARPIAELASECWNLESVALEYREFLKRFEPATGLLTSKQASPEICFVVQTLLIHSFRRVSLHDPRLPDSVLPADWPGHAAYEVCREIYRSTFPGAQEFVVTKLSEVSEQPELSRDVLARFGGFAPV